MSSLDDSYEVLDWTPLLPEDLQQASKDQDLSRLRQLVEYLYALKAYHEKKTPV